MKKYLSILILVAIIVNSYSQDPFSNSVNGSNSGPSHVGGSVTIDVNKLVSTNDAQELLNQFGAITVQVPVKNYYSSVTPNLKKVIDDGVKAGLFQSKSVGAAIYLALTNKGKGLLVSSVVENGITVWFLAAGLCHHPIANYTSPGTKSGKPGQTLTFSTNLDYNTSLGDLLGYNSASHQEYSVDIVPTSSGWMIDKNQVGGSIQQASNSAVGLAILQYLSFVEELPSKMIGNKWSRRNKKSTKQDVIELKKNMTCTYYNAKEETTKEGMYSFSGNNLILRLNDGEIIDYTVHYKEYGINWFILTPKSVVWSFDGWKFYKEPIE